MNKIMQITTLLLSFFVACVQEDSGSLLVESLHSGEFEIFRIGNKRLLSKTKGMFNSAVNLAPGQYLLLADCSSKVITISANITRKVSTLNIEFIAPCNLKNKTKFSIKCLRSKNYNYHQVLNNKYFLNILPNNHELLINMSKLKIDKNKNRKISLAALVVKAEKKYNNMFYYIASLKSSASTVLSQNLNSSLLLLPGKYKITVNGTTKIIDLKPEEDKIIDLSYLRVVAKQKIHPKNIYLFIDKEVPVSLNEDIPIISKSIRLNFKGSYEDKFVTVSAKKTTVEAKSVIAKLGCAPWEWECLGKAQVLLYNKNFKLLHKGKSDELLYYFSNDAYLGFKGSEGLYYPLSKEKSHTELNLGSLRLIPIPKNKKGLLSDLAQVTAYSKQIKGHSKDIPFTHKTTMIFVEGKYVLSVYTSNSDYTVSKKDINFTIQRGKSTKLKFFYYTSKRKQKQRLVSYKKEKNELKDQQVSAIKSILY
jgi:hypothetical protein